MKRLLILSLALLATACARESSAVLQGYGEADYIYLSSQETGVVSELNVREGDAVEAGARVFSLDPDRLAPTPRRAGAAAVTTGPKPPCAT
jgi:HlyD family secretion protein